MCRYLQAYKEGGKVRLVAPNNTQSFPGRALLEHLGHVHDLPRSLGLRVEVDGVLGEQVHDAVVKGDSYVFCAAAFQPLVGKQYVAWRFIRPDTLVCAVKIAGCSVAAAGGGERRRRRRSMRLVAPHPPLSVSGNNNHWPGTHTRHRSVALLAPWLTLRRQEGRACWSESIRSCRCGGGGVDGCMHPCPAAAD